MNPRIKRAFDAVRRRYRNGEPFYQILAEECGYDREIMSAVGKYFGTHGGRKSPGTGIHAVMDIPEAERTLDTVPCQHFRVCLFEALCADSQCHINGGVK